MAKACNREQLQESVSGELDRLQALASDGIVEDDAGNVVKDTIEELTSMRDAMELQDSRVVDEIASRLTVVGKMRETYPDGLPVQFNGESNTVRHEKIENATFDDGYIKLVTDKGTYQFLQGQNRSITFKKDEKFAFVKDIGSITNGFMDQDTDEIVLGSTKKATKRVQWSKFERLEKNVHGNVTAMKELLNEVHVLGGSKESQEHMDYLQDLFSAMSPEFFDKMKTFITKTTEESSGIMQGRNLGIKVNPKQKSARNQLSEATIYAHEVIHSMIVFALRSGSAEARKLHRELEFVMETAAKKMSYKNFLPEGVSVKDATQEEMKVAKEAYDYIFTSKNAKDEFVAHVLTNPALMAFTRGTKLTEKKEDLTLFEKVREMFLTLLDVALGRYKLGEKDKDLYSATLSIAMSLGEINNRTVIETGKKDSIVNKVQDILKSLDKKISDTYDNVLDKFVSDNTDLEPYPRNSSITTRSIWVSKLLIKSAGNETYANALGLLLSSWGLSPHGLVRSIFKDLSDQDAVSKALDWLTLQAGKIDGVRMSFINITTKVFHEGFNEPLTDEQEHAITRAAFDTDLASIYGKKGYSNKEIRTLLTDEDVLDTKISRAKFRLKELDEKNYNWHTNQASGLGFYLATHKAHIAQNMNAFNIAKGTLSLDYKKPTKKLIEAIDEVATLVALKYTDETAKNDLAELMKNDHKGVENVISMHRGFKKDSAEMLFEDDKTHIVKGYTKEVFSEDMEMEISTIANRKEMEKAGFTLAKVLEPHSSESNPVPMGMYIAKYTGKSEYLRSATRLTGQGTKGTSITQIKHMDGGDFAQKRADTDKLKMDKARLIIVDSMVNGTFDKDKVEYGIAPVTDSNGRVTDYRHMMNKKSKQEYLGQDMRASEIMARSVGSMMDKNQSLDHNKKVLDFILKDMKENWEAGTQLGKDLEEFALIGPGSVDKEMQEIYKMLPSSFKHAINQRQDKQMAVRKDLLHVYFGYRHASLANFPGLEKITPGVIKTLIKFAETLWASMIQIVKTNILMKMPMVLVGNVVSNFLFDVVRGANPLELLATYKESFRDVKSYVNNQRQMVELQVKASAGKLTPAQKTKIKMLDKSMRDNPIHELMDLGLYTAIQEDVESASLRNTNKWKRILDEKTKSVPSMIKTPVQWLYLSEETSWYKFNQEVLQMSDLLARDAMNRRLKADEKKHVVGQKELPRWWTMRNKKKGDKYTPERKRLTGKDKEEFLRMSKEQRHTTLLESFINYNKPSPKLEEYANRMGAVMFTKYFKRIQLVIKNTLKGNFASSLLILAGQQYLVDAEMIFDQSIATKNWSDVGGMAIPVRVYSPLDNIMSVLTPALVKPETYAGLIL